MEIKAELGVKEINLEIKEDIGDKTRVSTPSRSLFLLSRERLILRRTSIGSCNVKESSKLMS